MKALLLKQYTEAKEAFVLQEVPTPTPQENEVLIEVECFGLNYADVMARQGLYKAAPPLPAILGYDVVGRIKEVHASVDRTWIGKRVVAMTRFGGYAEFATTNIDAMAEISETINATKACALATQYNTAFYMANTLTTIIPGDHVLMHAAAGGVGIALTQLAKLAGATTIGLVGNDNKKEIALKNGIDHVINYKKVDYHKEIVSILTDKKLDLVFNSVGGKTFKNDLQLLNAGGRIATYGVASMSGKKLNLINKLKLMKDTGLLTPLILLGKSKSILGVNILQIADHNPKVIKHCLTKVVELLETNQIDPLVGGEYNVNDFWKAHEKFGENETFGKIGIYWKRLF